MSRQILVIFMCLFSLPSFASMEVIVEDDYLEIRKQILTDYASISPSELLIAFDIDETLLVVEECLSPEDSKGFGGWLSMVFKCPAHLTEETVDDYVAEFQGLGFATLALTARGDNILKPTERELLRNGLNFKDRPFGEEINFEEPFTKKSSVVFKDGVTYSSGRNKGQVMQLLLSRLPGDFKQVVFIDDNVKNIRAMSKAYEQEPKVHVRIYHYTRFND